MKRLPLIAFSVLATACASPPPVEHNTPDNTVDFRPSDAASAFLPDGHRFAESYEIHGCYFVAIRSSDAPLTGPYVGVVSPHQVIDESATPYLPVGVIHAVEEDLLAPASGDPPEVELVLTLEGTIGRTASGLQQRALHAKPGWQRPHYGMPSPVPPPAFADVRLRACMGLNPYQDFVDRVSHGRFLDEEALAIQARVMVLDWWDELPKTGLCGLALFGGNELAAFEIFHDTKLLHDFAIPLIAGFMASVLMDDLDGEDTWTLNYTSDSTLLAFWEEAPLSEVAAALTDGLLIVALSDEIEADQPSTYDPSWQPGLPGKLVGLAREIGGWARRGDTLVLVSTATADTLRKSGVYGDLQSIFEPYNEHDWRLDPPDLPATLTKLPADWFSWKDSAGRPAEERASIRDNLIERIEDALDAAGTTESEAESIALCNAVLKLSLRSIDWYIEEEEAQLFAMRAHLIVGKARHALGITQPNPRSVNRTTNGSAPARVRTCNDTTTGKTVQYSFIRG